MKRTLVALVLSSLAAACQSPAPVGAVCTRSDECASPNVCRLGRCRTECAEQRDCPAGSTCFLDANGLGSCALASDSCTAANACPAPLACFDGACANLCEQTIVSCAPGSSCRASSDGRARCVRDDDVDAGDTGVADAGPPDANDVDAGCLGPGCDPVAHIAIASASTCVLTEGHALWCWGRDTDVARNGDTSGCDTSGACIAPHRVQQRIAGNVSDATHVTTVSGSNAGYCYVASGRVICFGHDGYTAPLGLGVVDGTVARPVADATGASPPTDFESVDVANLAAIATRPRADWLFWGEDIYAERGDDADAGTNVLDPASLLSPIVADATVVSAGGWHFCAISPAGVSCWGQNDNGQSGGPSIGAEAHQRAALVPNIVGMATELATGRGVSCALASPDVWCWGQDLAMGSAAPAGCVMGGDRMACPAARVVRDPSVQFVHLGTSAFVDVICAIDDQHRIWCWGDGNTLVSPHGGLAPTLVDVGGPVSEVAIGLSHACALVEGNVLCWGQNDHGQLGRDTAGATDPTPAPVVW